MLLACFVSGKIFKQNEMRKNFADLFAIQNGMVTPKTSVGVNGIVMGPGVAFGSGVSFGGVDLSTLVGKDLEVEAQGEVTIIKGYYQ